MDSDPERSLCADFGLVLGREDSPPGSALRHSFKKSVDSKDCAVCQLFVTKLGESRAYSGTVRYVAYQPDCPVALRARAHPYENWNFGSLETYAGGCESSSAEYLSLTLIEAHSPDPKSPYHVKIDPD